MIFAISTQTTLSLSYSKLEYSPSRNLKSNTSAGKSSLCFSESWFGEGNLKLGLPETRLASESSTQNTPWNSTLSSAETAKAKVPKTQSTPKTGQRYPDLDAPKLCWILMPISHYQYQPKTRGWERTTVRVGSQNFQQLLTKVLVKWREGKRSQTNLTGNIISMHSWLLPGTNWNSILLISSCPWTLKGKSNLSDLDLDCKQCKKANPL